MAVKEVHDLNKDIGPIAIIVRRKNDTAIDRPRYSAAFTKKNTVDATKTCNDFDQSRLSFSSCVGDDTACWKSSRCRSKLRHNNYKI